jgi:hypothetical protein
MLKFLFSGSIGHDLVQGVLSESLDALEEAIVLVQETSVSIVYTREAKNILKPWVEACPMLVEYLPLEEEEGDIDLLQARKCVNFKRMILEALPAGTGVGIPIPLGYDGVLDVESWSIMQSFALDDIYMPTGFFTSRYNVIDVTEFMDLLIRTVDTCHVDNAIRVVSHTILPHMNQCVGVLDTGSADLRARLTSSEVLSPLDMLYEFGELHCAEPADPALRPTLLVGNGTCHLGSTRTQLQATIGDSSSNKYPENKVNANSHMIVEACEPSTGVRWCRTYMLHKGRHSATLRDAAALVEREEDLLLEAYEKEEEIAAVVSMREVLTRLDCLYLKLQHCLAWAVRVAFSNHDDVLEAGQFVQLALSAAMKGDSSVEGIEIPFPDRLSLAGVKLQGSEQLQVFMDCMNSFGKVVSIEDVDDMGGTCWTYIRVSIHNVDISAAGSASSDAGNGAPSGLAAVAVGDTFLFSGNSCQRTSTITTAAELGPRIGGLLATAGFDAYCVTRALPYHRSFVGPGPEDRSVKRFISSVKSPSMLSALGLGKVLNTEVSPTGIMTLPLLTDHPLLPYTSNKGCEFKAFGGGFVIEKDNTSCVPMLVSIETHVEKMWTVDLKDVFAKSMELVQAGSGASVNDEDDGLQAEEGLIVIFQLKSFSPEAVTARLSSRTGDQQEEDARLEQELLERRERFAAGHVDVLGEMENDSDEEELAYSAQKRVAKRKEEELVSMLTKKALDYNPLQRSLPISGSDGGKEHLHLAFIVPSASKSAQDMSKAISKWRDSLRLHGLPDIRGAEKELLPASILKSFALYTDAMHAATTSGGSSAAHVSSVDQTFRVDPAAMLSSVPPASLLTQVGLIDRLGLGYNPLRCVHALNELKRLQTAREDESDNGGESKSGEGKMAGKAKATRSQVSNRQAQLVVVAGHAGSGVLLIGNQVADRMDKSLRERATEQNNQSAPAMSVFGGLAAAAAAETSSPSAKIPDACGCVVVDFSTLKRGASSNDIAALVEDAWTDYYANLGDVKGDRDQVVVLSVVTSAHCHLRFEDVLSLLLRACGGASSSHVAAVVSVANGASLFSTSLPLGNIDDDSQCAGAPSGVGAEVWRASGMQALYTGNISDVVICVDSTGNYFTALRSMLANYQSSALAVRVSADGLRLEEEVMERLLNCTEEARSVTAAVTGLTVVSKRICAARGLALPFSSKLSLLQASTHAMGKARVSGSPAPALPYLRTVPLLPPSNGPGQSAKEAASLASVDWSVNSLLSCLQALFPTAILNSDVVSDAWQMPAAGTRDTKGLSGFRLATYCAKAKVLKKRQMEAEALQLSHEVRKLRAMKRKGISSDSSSGDKAQLGDLSAFVGGLLSVHGVVRIPSGTPLDGGAKVPLGLAILEACEGSIILRAVEPGTADYSLLNQSSNVVTNQLVVQGVVSNESAALLEDIFGLCGKYRLPHKPERTRKDLTSSEEETVAQQNEHVPLGPSAVNWTYDGYGYVDYIGNRRKLRPDIEPMLEVYLERQNERVAEYNKMVTEVMDLL